MDGTGPNGVGDDWGTWGGYHRWEDAKIVQGCWGPGTFTATLWLEDSSAFLNDRCPVDYLDADMYVRRLPYEQATYCDFGSNPQAAWLADLYSIEDNYFQQVYVECIGDELMKITGYNSLALEARFLKSLVLITI